MTVRCSVFVATSLDGYIARKNGAIDWLANPGDENNAENYGYKEFFNSVDTLVIGRATYELVLSFKDWPYTGKKVIVLSHASPAVPAHLQADVQVMSCSPSELVQHLSKEDDHHLYIDGGRTIQGFLRAGLIHEMTITRLPILIGGGIPLFGKLDRDVRFRLLETKAYPNGYVQSRYRAVDAA